MDDNLYRNRVLEERDELLTKQTRLAKFLNANETNGGKERDLLIEQFNIMQQYINVLHKRIATWNSTELNPGE